MKLYILDYTNAEIIDSVEIPEYNNSAAKLISRIAVMLNRNNKLSNSFALQTARNITRCYNEMTDRFEFHYE